MLKILSIGNFTRGWDGSICDEEHIAKALEQMGHTVFRGQRDSGWAFDHDCDFTLVAQWDGYDMSLLEAVPKPIVYWAFDYQADGQPWHEALVNMADLYLSKRIADSKYPNWQWLCQDFAPNFLRPITTVPARDIDVLFTGSYLPWATERIETLKAVDEKFNLVIHSVNAWPEGFKDVRGPIMDEGLPELYARAKVILSIDHTIEAGYWSDRNAQIMACGQRPLFLYVPMSTQVFGNRVDYFYNIEDCLEKIKPKLDNQDYRTHFIPDHSAGLHVFDRAADLVTIVESHLAKKD